MTSPTEKQIALLGKFKITVVPTTKVACARLISYILKGNCTKGSTIEERISLAHSYWKKWCGARVLRNRDGSSGVVVVPHARTRADVWNRAPGRGECAPFKLQIKWNDGRTTITTISEVSILQ